MQAANVGPTKIRKHEDENCNDNFAGAYYYGIGGVG